MKDDSLVSILSLDLALSGNTDALFCLTGIFDVIMVVDEFTVGFLDLLYSSKWMTSETDETVDLSGCCSVGNRDAPRGLTWIFDSELLANEFKLCVSNSHSVSQASSLSADICVPEIKFSVRLLLFSEFLAKRSEMS